MKSNPPVQKHVNANATPAAGTRHLNEFDLDNGGHVAIVSGCFEDCELCDVVGL